jgi:hypothetical protein
MSEKENKENGEKIILHQRGKIEKMWGRKNVLI